MFCHLSIENYILIRRLEIDLSPNLNIITGQTGAGKSILLGALGLLMGAKNDASVMRDQSKSCVIEGTFNIEGYNLQELFESHDLEYEPQTIIRRVISVGGKSRAYINDLPVQLAVLRAVTSRLIDIHSQHQNLLLNDDNFRTQVVDALAENEDVRRQYTTKYSQMFALKREVAQAREDAQTASRDEEWLRFQVEELTSVALREGEMQELEQEQGELANAEGISTALFSIRGAMEEEATGILERVKEAERHLKDIIAHYPQAEAMAERLHGVNIELKDIAQEISSESERGESNPQRFEQGDTRLATLYSHIKKHRVADLAELIEVRDRNTAQLNTIEQGEEYIKELEQRLAKASEEEQ